MKRFPLHRRRTVRRADSTETTRLPETPPAAPRTEIEIGDLASIAEEFEAMLARVTMDAAKSLVGDDSAAVVKRLNDVNEALHSVLTPICRRHGTTLFMKIAIAAYLYAQIGHLPGDQQTGIIALGRNLADRSVRAAGGYDALIRQADPKVN